MAQHRKTIKLIEAAKSILAEYNPMTLRQVYYQLVSRHIIENKITEYVKLSRALKMARKEEYIPWHWIEDRLRQIQAVSMWTGIADFLKTVKRSYRRDTWESQPQIIEVWLEKDALSGIFSRVTRNYRVPLLVTRGFNSWTAYAEAIERFEEQGKPVKILVFTDFDPSGEDIVRAHRESIEFFDTSIKIIIEKIALNQDDVITYDLPPVPTKKTDLRAKQFIARHGDACVELDALPPAVLIEKIKESIEGNIDIDAFEEVKETEEIEQRELEQAINRMENKS